MADNQPVPMPPHIKAELARLRALMATDAEAYRRREIGSKRMEEEAKKIQPLRPLSAADTDLEYLSAAKGGIISQLRRNGKGVSSELEAMRRMSQGHRVFVTHEQDERPREITSVLDLHAYTPDQMYTLAPEGKANGGQVDMDRMRLELMNGKKKFLEPSVEKGVMYHGTRKNFSEFKSDKGGAHFVSPDPKFASKWSLPDPAYPEDPTGANVMPVHVQVKNPFDYDNPKHVNKLIKHMKAHPNIEKILSDYDHEDINSFKKAIPWGSYFELEIPEVQQAIKKMGHDAFYVNEGASDMAKNLGVYDPKKIKSAIGNRGTYDTTNPDITKAKGGSVKEPKNTVKAYKLFRVHPKHPGKLFPLFVNANEPVEMNKWVDAKEGEMAGDKVKSKIGPLAYRPGWHAGDLPVATHIGEKSDPNLTAPDVRPANHVWAEVEMPHDVDWQSVANERGMNPKGKLIARNAHITDQIPKGGHYRYKTNSNMTGNWLIGGAMKVNRVLQDKEVKAINKAAGASDLPRTRPFKAKDYGFAKGGVVAPEEFMAEEHVNYMAKGGVLPKHRSEANLEKFLSKSHVKHPLYHGTSGKDFDNPVGTTYLSNLPHIANTYAGKDAVSPRVMPVYANMKNPLIVNSRGERWDALPTNTTVKGKSGHDTLKDIVGDDYPFNTEYDTGHVADYARKHGYDSVIFKHLEDVGAGELEGKSPFSDVHVVFDPESQLKSAIGNRGTYNKKVRDITKKNGGITHAHHLDIEERPL